MTALWRWIKWRSKMARFGLIRWNDDYMIRVIPARSDIRSIITNLLPYFWDTSIALGIRVRALKKRPKDDLLKYQWELQELDETTSAKKGYGEIGISHTSILGNKWIEKDRAIILGNLHPHRYYRLFITFSDSAQTSERFLAGTLTVKDRDEMYMQAFILIVGILFAFIILLIEMGGS